MNDDDDDDEVEVDTVIMRFIAFFIKSSLEERTTDGVFVLVMEGLSSF